MTRDELERLAKFLDQGLVLDRETQKRLVTYALGTKPREHLDGCAWWRGAGCDCADQAEPMDMALKEALTK